jgi:hypothetical protein
MLLRFWHHHFSAHVLLLEKGLISSMKDLYDALAIVLFDGEAVNDDDQEHHTTFVNSSGGNEDSTFKNRWPHLSVQVYLACSREKLEKSATHPSVTMLGKLGDIGRGGMMSGRMLKASSSAAINRLWSEIIANLDKDMNEHTNCSFNCVYRLPSASTARLRPQTTPLSTVEAKVVADEVAKNASKAVAFTCGHVYQHTYFYTELVPELMARLEKLHPRIPSTAKLVEIEYGKRVIGLACPPCLLASLLQEQHRLHRTLSAKKQSLLIPPQNKRYATT